MMDTVLNVGLNRAIATDLAVHSERPRHAWDCYRRLISMYGDVVAGVPKATFEDALASAKAAAGVAADVDLDAAAVHELCEAFAAAYAAATGTPFPSDPWAMLRASVEGVVRSWDNPRAVKVRSWGSGGCDCGKRSAKTFSDPRPPLPPHHSRSTAR